MTPPPPVRIYSRDITQPPPLIVRNWLTPAPPLVLTSFVHNPLCLRELSLLATSPRRLTSSDLLQKSVQKTHHICQSSPNPEQTGERDAQPIWRFLLLYCNLFSPSPFIAQIVFHLIRRRRGEGGGESESEGGKGDSGRREERDDDDDRRPPPREPRLRRWR